MNATKLIDAIKAAGLRPRSYSGRGMFGRHCVGVSLRSISEADGLPLRGSATDSLGLGIILYWPGAKWPEEE